MLPFVVHHVPELQKPGATDELEDLEDDDIQAAEPDAELDDLDEHDVCYAHIPALQLAGNGDATATKPEIRIGQFDVCSEQVLRSYRKIACRMFPWSFGLEEIESTHSMLSCCHLVIVARSRKARSILTCPQNTDQASPRYTMRFPGCQASWAINSKILAKALTGSDHNNATFKALKDAFCNAMAARSGRVDNSGLTEATRP